jgi:hypothetical protein
MAIILSRFLAIRFLSPEVTLLRDPQALSFLQAALLSSKDGRLANQRLETFCFDFKIFSSYSNNQAIFLYASS